MTDVTATLPERAADAAQVLIAGGGPVGMALAIELGQRGIRTIVVERHLTPQPVPKGQNLTQRTMEHFRAWGAEDALRGARTIPASCGIGGMTSYRSLLGDYRYDWLQRGLVAPYYAAANERLPQYRTEAVLRARAAQIGCIDIRYGWDAVGASQGIDGVSLEIAARDGGESRRLTGEFLVGCDGSKSVIRQAAGITQTLSDHDRLMVLLVFKSPQLTALLARFPNKSFFNVLHPDQKGYWLFFGRVDMEDRWFFHAPVPPEAREEGFDFSRLLHDAVGTDFDFDLQYTGFWDLRFSIADTYRIGRVFVAGDAAHSHPPYGGYGINTGFEDARNLGWKLAATLQGWGGGALLDSYHAERHGVFESTAKDFIEKAIDVDRHFLESHDPEIDRETFEAEWCVREQGARGEVGSFEPHYEGSPVVCDKPGAGGSAAGEHRFIARVGHHLSPVGGVEPATAAAAGFTLLVDDSGGDDGADFCRAAANLEVPLARAFRAELSDFERLEAKMVLVRPDGFVAWTSAARDSSTDDVLSKCTGRVMTTGRLGIRVTTGQ